MRHHDLDKRKESIGKLQSIISALRAMAALRVQRDQKPVAGTRHYQEIVALTISRFIGHQEKISEKSFRDSKSLLIVFCSEYGFVGGFNRPLLEMARDKASPARDIALIGSRGAMIAAEYGINPVWKLPMSSDKASVQKTVQQIARRLLQAVGEGVSSVKLIYMKQQGTSGVQISGAQIKYHPLFPVDRECFPESKKAESLPLLNMPSEQLLHYLTEEYLMASLSCAVMESLHAENYSRLSAMDQAHQNIQKKYEQLQQQSHQLWQEEITTELLDIITGFVAQTKH